MNIIILEDNIPQALSVQPHIYSVAASPLLPLLMVNL